MAGKTHGTEDGAAHKHGSMDITTHEKTFEGFVRLTKIAIVLIIGALIFLALANV